MLGAAVFGALVIGPQAVPPAFAHDALVSSSPPEGAVLDAMPDTIELTFSGELMELGAIVQVRDPEGVDHTLSDPEVAAAVVTVAVDPAADDGSYAIVWRVVSSDGHPISGSVPFVVGAPTPVSQATDAASAAPDRAEHTEPGTTEDDRAGSDQTAPNPWDSGGPARIALVAIAGAALALGLLIAGITLGRRRTAVVPHRESARDPAGLARPSHEEDHE